MATRLSTSEYLDSLRAYWRDTHEAYFKHVGTTFQSSYVTVGTHPDPATRSNLYVAAAAGIQPGYRVLDAGCGVCGPALDIAANTANVSIAGLTISLEQAQTAFDRVHEAGLESRVTAIVADYHHVPFPNDSFDIVLFLECTGYSYDLAGLLMEAFRVTRPGGGLFVKDVVRRPHIFTEDERALMEEFDRSWVLHHTNSLDELRTAASAAGYESIETRDLSGAITTDHAVTCMFEFLDGVLQPTRLGELHYPVCSSPSVVFHGELRASKPPNREGRYNPSK